jgi:hypothetical protein
MMQGVVRHFGKYKPGMCIAVSEGLFNGLKHKGLPKAILATPRIVDSGGVEFWLLLLSPRVRIKIETVTEIV